jgi:phycocyanobilin lyase subunit beta
MSDTLPSLISAIETADSSSKLLEAVQNLADTRLVGAVPTLIAALSYNNPGAAVAAVDGLIQIGEPAVNALVELLDEYNYTARAWAIRALAGIGDPRGLVTLLGAATADFALSVRRAAARGLGTMQWQWFPPDLLEVAQAEALEALLFVAQHDDEWVVRYSAVVGLQSLAVAIASPSQEERSQIQTQLQQMTEQDKVGTVRARASWALQQIQTTPSPQTKSPSAPPEIDWQDIMSKLYERRCEERTAVINEGDPRLYRDLAVSIASDQE